jgi:hypothetical protein
MKTNFFAALTIITLFTSCQKDVKDELSAADTTTSLSHRNESITDCKACEYYPTCTGSVYNYSEVGGKLFTSITIGKPVSYTLEFIADSIINNIEYRKMKAENDEIGFYDCADGVTTKLTYFTNVAFPQFSSTKTTILKANEPIGGMWKDTVDLTNTQKEIYEYNILEKGTTRAVGGVLYEDIIRVRKNIFLLDNGITTNTNRYFEHYYAKGIGLIETKSINMNGNGSITFHRILTSAIIP